MLIANQSVSQSVSQSASQPVSQSASQPVSQSVFKFSSKLAGLQRMIKKQSNRTDF